MSLGLSGIGLSYVAFLAPYQRYFQLFAIGMLFLAHYRMEKQAVKKSTEIFIWAATVMVVLLMLSPAITRLLIL
jgi:hypothetical protein